MNLKNKNIGFAFTGSFCAFQNVIEILKKLKKEGANIIPIMSKNAYEIDTKFGKSKEFINEIEEISERKIIQKIVDAERIGKKEYTDIMAIVPCSGNTLAKLSYGIIDSTVTVAVKYHLRNSNPVVIGISTNDGLSGSAENIGRLLNRSNYFFVPFKQDNPITKPRSIVFDREYVIKTIKYALKREQIQPIIL